MVKNDRPSSIIERLELLAKEVKAEQDAFGDKQKEGSFENSYHEQRLAELRREEEADYLSARWYWRKGIGCILGLTVLMHLAACIMLFWMEANENVLGAVTISLTVEVLGLAAIILKHLFPKKR